jgi:hypothetical protein
MLTIFIFWFSFTVHYFLIADLKSLGLTGFRKVFLGGDITLESFSELRSSKPTLRSDESAS